jgi:hypothetical protein
MRRLLTWTVLVLGGTLLTCFDFWIFRWTQEDEKYALLSGAIIVGNAAAVSIARNVVDHCAATRPPASCRDTSRA